MDIVKCYNVYSRRRWGTTRAPHRPAAKSKSDGRDPMGCAYSRFGAPPCGAGKDCITGGEPLHGRRGALVQYRGKGASETRLIQGDCLELMRTIPDHSVDMVLADPPYGTTGCKWDKVIPINPLWDQIERVIKANGVICLFASEPFASKIRLSNIAHYKYDWIWIKSKGANFVHAKNQPLKRHEEVLVFSYAPMGHASVLGDRRMRYYPQGLKEKTTTRRNASKKFGGCFGSRPSQLDVVTSRYTGYPGSLLEFRNETGYHQTQKPVPLLEYLIKTYTLEGDTVLDFAAGSGSTGVAARNLSREFIGIEIDPEWCDIARQRLGLT